MFPDKTFITYFCDFIVLPFVGINIIDPIIDYIPKKYIKKKKEQKGQRRYFRKVLYLPVFFIGLRELTKA